MNLKEVMIAIEGKLYDLYLSLGRNLLSFYAFSKLYFHKRTNELTVVEADVYRPERVRNILRYKFKNPIASVGEKTPKIITEEINIIEPAFRFQMQPLYAREHKGSLELLVIREYKTGVGRFAKFTLYCIPKSYRQERKAYLFNTGSLSCLMSELYKEELLGERHEQLS